jgi:hypothetical protein
MGLILTAWLAAGCGTEQQRILNPRLTTAVPALESTMQIAGVVGPRICFSSEIVDYCYPDGGYCLCESAIAPAEIPAGRVLTLNWQADPQPGTNIHWYRWAVDIADVFDETPRIDEETDLAHWSQRSATVLSAQLGPWNLGDVHLFRLEVTDDLGMRSLGTIRFTVVPAVNQPPAVDAAVADPALLWPPDHRLVAVSIQGVSDPDGDPVAVRVTRVTQDESPADTPLEPDPATNASIDAEASVGVIDGNPTVDAGGVRGDHAGDGRSCGDAVIHPDGRVELRAERSARGDGRVYRIWFTASDPAGATSEGSVRVCVPLDPRDRDCGDDGQFFDSLGTCGTDAVLQSFAP